MDGELPALDSGRVLRRLRELPPDTLVEPGVTAGDALTVMSVPPTPAGARYVADQVYGTAGANGRPLTMHLYAAAEPGERRPGVVFVHGGAFQEGFPERTIRYANHLAARGYVTASITYRLSGEAPWPACLEDAKCSIRWMRANAARIGLDPDRLAVAGGSAGGTLAQLVGSTPGDHEGSGGHLDVPSTVRAVVAWYPVVDLRPSRCPPVVIDVAAKLFDMTEVTDEVTSVASSILYGEVAPPTLTFVGSDDPVVPLTGIRAYHDNLDAAGTDNELVVVDGVGHSFDYNLTRWNECFETATAFLDRHL